MSLPRPRTICRRTRCGYAFSQHLLIDGTESEYACPNGTGETFRRNPTSKGAASQSFSAEEINALHTIVTGLVRRADLTQVARSKVFASVARKVGVMSARSKAGAR